MTFPKQYSAFYQKSATLSHGYHTASLATRNGTANPCEKAAASPPSGNLSASREDKRAKIVTR